MMSEPEYGQPSEDEPGHEPWNHNFESQSQNWKGHWRLDGDWLSKTQLCREFNLTKKEFAALLEKAKKVNLQLRTKTLKNEQYDNFFTVYNLEDLKKILSFKR